VRDFVDFDGDVSWAREIDDVIGALAESRVIRRGSRQLTVHG
jgi:hypothetical protein